MSTNIKYEIAGRLSDAQHLMTSDPKTAIEWLNEAKALLFEYMDDKYAEENEIERVINK